MPFCFIGFPSNQRLARPVLRVTLEPKAGSSVVFFFFCGHPLSHPAAAKHPDAVVSPAPVLTEPTRGVFVDAKTPAAVGAGSTSR